MRILAPPPPTPGAQSCAALRWGVGCSPASGFLRSPTRLRRKRGSSRSRVDGASEARRVRVCPPTPASLPEVPPHIPALGGCRPHVAIRAAGGAEDRGALRVSADGPGGPCPAARGAWGSPPSAVWLTRRLASHGAVLRTGRSCRLDSKMRVLSWSDVFWDWEAFSCPHMSLVKRLPLSAPEAVVQWWTPCVRRPGRRVNW